MNCADCGKPGAKEHIIIIEPEMLCDECYNEIDRILAADTGNNSERYY